jgi:hypothetical protein
MTCVAASAGHSGSSTGIAISPAPCAPAIRKDQSNQPGLHAHAQALAVSARHVPNGPGYQQRSCGMTHEHAIDHLAKAEKQ